MHHNGVLEGVFHLWAYRSTLMRLRPDERPRNDAMMATAPTERCDHFAAVGNPDPRPPGCEECMATGQTWVALRVCLSCGHVGCCEDSPGAHALEHFQSTEHPIIRPLERDERWTWCYPHNRYFAAL